MLTNRLRKIGSDFAVFGEEVAPGCRLVAACEPCPTQRRRGLKVGLLVQVDAGGLSRVVGRDGEAGLLRGIYLARLGVVARGRRRRATLGAGRCVSLAQRHEHVGGLICLQHRRSSRPFAPPLMEGRGDCTLLLRRQLCRHICRLRLHLQPLRRQIRRRRTRDAEFL